MSNNRAVFLLSEKLDVRLFELVGKNIQKLIMYHADRPPLRKRVEIA